MKVTLRTKKGLRHFVARTKNAICRRKHSPKIFTITNEKPLGKSPLDMMIDDHYLQVLYSGEVNLHDFFLWASIDMFALNDFFRQAKYKSAPQYQLNKFFQFDRYPKVCQYNFGTFFQLVLYDVAPKYEVDKFFDGVSLEEAPAYELDVFFRMAQYPELREYGFGALFTEVWCPAASQFQLNELFSSNENELGGKIKPKSNDNGEFKVVCMKIKRSSSCSLKVRNPLKQRCLSSTLL